MLLALAFTLASEFVLLFAFSLSAFLAFAVLSGVGRALASGALEAWFIDSLQTADPDIEIQPALALAGTFELFALGTRYATQWCYPHLVWRFTTGRHRYFHPFFHDCRLLHCYVHRDPSRRGLACS